VTDPTNNMQSLIFAKHVDVSKISFGQIRTNDSGGKNISILYDGKPLYVQTPEMTCVYGLSKWPGDGKNDKYSVELSFQGQTPNNGLGKFLKVLGDMNDKFLQAALDNSLEWFRKKYTSKDVVEAIYTPLIKYSKDKNTGEVTDRYPPTFRLNVPINDGKVGCLVYDANRSEIDLLDPGLITKSSKMTAIIRLSGVWIAGGKFGCTCRVEQLRVIPQRGLAGYAIQDDDDDIGGNELILNDEDDDIVFDDAPGEIVEPVASVQSAPPPPIPDSDDEKPKIIKPRKKAAAKQ
jgi:hypothetical protein